MDSQILPKVEKRLDYTSLGFCSLREAPLWHHKAESPLPSEPPPAGIRTLPYLLGRSRSQFTTAENRIRPTPPAGPLPGSPSEVVLTQPALCSVQRHCPLGTATSVVVSSGTHIPAGCWPLGTQLCLQHLISLGGVTGRTTATKGNGSGPQKPTSRLA